MAFLSSNSLPKLTISFLLLCSMAMAMAAGAKKATHLHFYMHDTLSGPSPTAIKVVPSGSSPASKVFGDITVIDDPLTEGPNMSSDLKNRGDHRPFEQVKANPSSSFLTHHPNSFPKIKHISNTLPLFPPSPPVHSHVHQNFNIYTYTPNPNPFHYHFSCIQSFQLLPLPLPPSPGSMGGCVSRPKELDGAKYQSGQDNKPVESGVSPKHGEGEGNAPGEEVEAETATEPEIKEEPLVDLSEPQPEAEKKKAAALSAEFSELTVSAPEAVEPAVAKEDTPAAEQVTATVEEVVEEKAKEAKETQVVADEESEAKVSA